MVQEEHRGLDGNGAGPEWQGQDMVSNDDVQGGNVIHVKFGVVVADDVPGRSIDDDTPRLSRLKSYADGSVATLMPDQLCEPRSTSRGSNRQVDLLAGLLDQSTKSDT